MSGRCIEKLPHSCGTSDALQVFEEDGNYTGFCFACQEFIPDPYGGADIPVGKKRLVKSDDEIREELLEIGQCPSCDLDDRKLRKETLDYFGVKIGMSEEDGITPKLHYYPYTTKGVITAYRTRLIEPKKFWMVGDMEKVDLWGWDQALKAGGKRLYITEGECDAMALFQALKDNSKGGKWEEYNPSIVSLTRGAGSVKRDLTEHLEDIRSSFKEVVFVFDKDDAGKKATHDGLQVIPTAKTVNLPAKDPNACLIEGRSKALCNAVLFNADVPKNTHIVEGHTLIEAGRTPTPYGLSWPWEGMTKLTRGIRFGETYYLGAGVKMGKSSVVDTLAAHMIKEHNLSIFLAKPEESNVTSWRNVCGKIAGRIFTDPDVEFDYDAYDAACKVIGNKLKLLSLYQHVGWESLRMDIVGAAAQGCKAVFIDPITNLTNGETSSEANSKLQEIAQELAALALDLDIVIFIFCHLKAPLAGPSHERGGEVLSSQFAGSRAMARSCHLMLGLEGDKSPNLPEEERNTRKLIILEDRSFGASGIVQLYYNSKNGLLVEV